ncbi:FAD-dependent oxidoreductase [Aestuariivivens sediminicola]|uniref:FAD-dependent oxidoreductase n=1 Tax=Aestuariivivens sediminicola TaxID=2913560 RepID=UPI001F5AF7E6|nr:GMC family oxidoreductase [Aestuariivivens sediminicola]
MHIDARHLPNNSIIEGDLCIIGAGAAGISMALDWNNSRHKVILLEGGGFDYDDSIQDLYSGKTSGQKYYPLRASRLHYFGGTTGHWAGMCAPFDPIDFKERPWVPHSGWPINMEDLEPYYAKANEVLEVGPYNYSYRYWNEKVPNLKPFPLDDTVIWNKIWQFSTARYNTLYRDTIVNSKNIHLYTYAQATNILTNDGLSEVSDIIVKNHEGKTHTVRAKQVILACGAIQNARLLLASNTQAPKGIGNQNDLVGRFFMEHLEIAIGELWLFEPFISDLYSWDYGQTRASAELAITEDLQEQEKILNGTVSLTPLKVAQYMKPRMETWQNEDPRKSMDNVFANWGEADEKGRNASGFIEKAHQLNIRIEQAPNPNSRITLDSKKDALGVPEAHLHWALTRLDKHSVRTIIHILGQEFGKSGLGRVKMKAFLRDTDDDLFPEETNGGWHHMGTTRMADDPQKGVVDSNCKVHGISNLFIAGSGCYPTSAAPNPTLSLTALSLRLSDHLKKKV